MSALVELNRFLTLVAASFSLSRQAQEAARQLLSKPWDKAVELLVSGAQYASLFHQRSRLERLLRDAPFIYSKLSQIEAQDDPDMFQRTTLLASWISSEIKGERLPQLNRLLLELFKLADLELSHDQVLLRLATQYIIGRLDKDHEDVRLLLMQLSAELGLSQGLLSDRVETIRDERRSGKLTLITPQHDLGEITLPRRALGREQERDELCELYSGGARCVIVHGIPGVGRSTLARMAVESLRSRYDGVLAIDAASYRSVDELWLRVAGFLLGDQAARLSPAEALGCLPEELYSGRRLLLIRDIDRGPLKGDAVGMIELLNALPLRAFQLLATSRVPGAGIEGEIGYPAGSDCGLGGLDFTSSIALCRGHCPNYNVGLDQLGIIARSLDGHPLACKVLSSILAWTGEDPQRFADEIKQRSILSLDPEDEEGGEQAVRQALGWALSKLLVNVELRNVLLFAATAGPSFLQSDLRDKLGAGAASIELQKLREMGLVQTLTADGSERYRLHPLLCEVLKAGPVVA
ncbi:MAG: ATP-binding protein [Candidatus Alcyoniella australis]|nr:ATP-binding protein [Candidatus Alcyoniella australis]